LNQTDACDALSVRQQRHVTLKQFSALTTMTHTLLIQNFVMGVAIAYQNAVPTQLD
jgi:hypothetical protein